MTKMSLTIISAILLSSPLVMAQEGDIAAQVVPQVLGRSPEDVRQWRAPIYTEQVSALGYSATAFAVPKGMEKQVQFWVDIYTKYNTHEGVIHDAENVEKVYQVVDLTGLKTEKEKQKKIDDVKKVISEGLATQEEKDRLRFQLGLKDRMQDAIFYSGRYLEDMEKIFRDAKVPVELTRLVFVESSFNIMARSKVGASGLWQIMPYTARPYKMMSPAIDQRNHPMEATKFAARLLSSNYRMLDSWPLAVTGYNHGPTGVRKMTEKYETRELGELIANVRSRKSFGFASRNFYASFLAALEVEKNAKKYFETVVWSKTLDHQELKLPVAVKYKQILAWFDGDDRKAQVFNPHLTYKARKGHPIPAKTVIAVPKDKYNVALISLARGDRSIAMEEKKASR